MRAAVIRQADHDDVQVQRVAAHLARTKAMADALAAVPLQPGDEPSEIFCPAPFPEEEPR